MKTHFLLLVSFSVLGFAACKGEVADLGGTSEVSQNETPDGGGQESGDASSTPSKPAKDAEAPSGLGEETCTLNPNPNLILPNSTLSYTTAAGGALSVDFEFQGKRIAIKQVTRVDHMTVTSDAPRAVGTDSGYWFELRDASENTLFTVEVTRVTERTDGPPAILPECQAKIGSMFVSNDAPERDNASRPRQIVSRAQEKLVPCCDEQPPRHLRHGHTRQDFPHFEEDGTDHATLAGRFVVGRSNDPSANGRQFRDR
jgi:hypothetical protein